MTKRTGRCPVCHKERAINKDETMRKHKGRVWETNQIFRKDCLGSGMPPKKAES